MVLPPAVERIRARTTVFERLQEKYKDAIHLPTTEYGNVIVFRPPNKNG